MSARWKLTLSYAGFLLVAGILLLAVVYLFLLRYVPEGNLSGPQGFIPDRSDLAAAFVPPATLTLLALLLVGLVGGWFLAGRMLAPLNRINEAARLASEGSLSHRIRMAGPRDEFRDLADGFDTMLERLERHVEEQRRFAANASHELRTPLAISHALLDVARADPDRDTEVLIERLQEVNARAIGLTEALLLLARADGGVFDVEPVDLSLLVEQGAETLQPLAERFDVSITVEAEEARTVGSGALLQQLVVNLVHNAIVHNLPAGGTVSVRTGAHAEGATLVIENSGDSLSADLVSTLAEPFQRGSQRARRSGADAGPVGVGLGLAIANSIVRAHAGTLTLAPRAAGGLTATVVLPAAA